jgi:hypothetical protein
MYAVEVVTAVGFCLTIYYLVCMKGLFEEQVEMLKKIEQRLYRQEHPELQER